MLEQFHAGEHIELAGMARGVVLGARLLVFHLRLALQQMKFGYAQRFFGKVDAGDACAARRHRLGEDAAAAADIEHARARELGAARDPVEPERIDVVQRPELALRIPPAVRELAELRELCRIDVHAPILPKKSPAEAGLVSSGGDAYFVLAEPELLDEEPALPGLRFWGAAGGVAVPELPLVPLALEPLAPLVELEPLLELAPPVVPAPAGAVAAPAVVSRLPRSSASTRRSGCRQAISFWFLLFSGPMRSH